MEKNRQFWLSAVATVATAGMIGAAIAQTTNSQGTTTDAIPPATTGAGGNPQGGTMSGNTGASSDAPAATSTTTAPSEAAPLAQADRG